MLFKKINRSSLLIWLKLLLSAAIIIFLFDLVKSSNLLAIIKTADNYLIGAAFILMFLNLYLQYSRWKTACIHLLNETERKKIFLSLFHGFSAGAVTPGRMGEYFARGIALPENSASNIAVSVFIEKLFPLVPVFLIGILSFFLFLQLNLLMIFFLFLLLITLAFILLKLLNRESISKRIMKNEIIGRRINKIFGGFALFKKLERTFVTKMIILSLLFYFCYIFQYALLVSAFSGNPDLIKYMWAGSLLFFAKAFIPPVTFGDLGIREGISVYFITRLGESAAAGLNASLFLFLINFMIPSLAGTAFLFTSKRAVK